MDKRSFAALLSADMAATPYPPDCIANLFRYLATPGGLCVALFRVQEAAYKRISGLGRVIRLLNHLISGADFVPGCKIGAGLRIEHPSGIVIGKGAVVGERAFILHGVTLGERFGQRRSVYPVLGNDVTVGVGATVLGGVKVGDSATIGAHALVLADVPSGHVATGIPSTSRGPQPRSV